VGRGGRRRKPKKKKHFAYNTAATRKGHATFMQGRNKRRARYAKKEEPRKKKAQKGQNAKRTPAWLGPGEGKGLAG